MNYAKQEMAKGQDISKIAHELGFYDQSHFSKTFKAYFGVTPQEYLK
jgi:AraC-like DNA-binding protein